jgi:hypothetical protein
MIKGYKEIMDGLTSIGKSKDADAIREKQKEELADKPEEVKKIMMSRLEKQSEKSEESTSKPSISLSTKGKAIKNKGKS